MIKLLEKYGFFPYVAVWELTLQCNLNCRHCGSRAGKPRADELTLAEARQLCRDLAALKCRQVTLSGGEPTLRRDWPLIAETPVELGVKVGMISNGLVWSDALSRTAKTVGLETVAFSVDGLEATHDHIRRSAGHFRKVMGAVESCTRAGLPVGAVTTINKRNLPELEALREELRLHGVKRWQVQLGTPTGNLADHPEMVLDPASMLTLVPLIAAMRRDGRRPKVYPGHDIGYYGEPEEDLRDPASPIPYWTGCSAGCHVVGIESNGNIKGCLSLPSAQNGVDAFVEGNIRDKPLAEIWRAEGAFAYNRAFQPEQLGGFCRSCDYAEICRGGCTWMSYAHKGWVRDNAFCYWRQTQEQAGEPRRHLPVMPPS
jgi:radical SAM protein with 4Fe4S-binding SPASM domain